MFESIVPHSIHFKQTVAFISMINSVETHVYHVGAIHYPLPVLCTYILFLLFILAWLDFCMLLIFGQQIILFCLLLRFSQLGWDVIRYSW